MTTLDIHSPLQDAVRQMAARTVVGSPMTSREWELLPAEIRLRSMFSARVEHERTLAEMQSRIVDGLANAKRDGATIDRARFVAEMSEMIKSNGYKRPDGVNRKSVQNLRSRSRLELIWNMNVAQARGYAKWLADMTPEGLENEPCYELVRIMPRQEHRDWPLVWADHGGKFYGTPGEDYPNAPGRMIAPKTDPIWRWISRFKTPWPPFDWGSGMGLDGIDIDEAEALGAIGPDEAPLAPLAEPFNASYQASAAAIPDDGRARVLSAFQGEAMLEDDSFRLVQASDLKPAFQKLPSPIISALRSAVEILRTWSESALIELANVVAKTVAWQRWAAVTGTSIFTVKSLSHALAQFMAEPDAMDAIKEIRETQDRDTFWCPADFSPVGRFLSERGLA